MVVSLNLAGISDAHNTVAYPADWLTVRRGLSFALSTAAPVLNVTPISAGPDTRGRPTSPPLRLTVDVDPVQGWVLTRAAEGAADTLSLFVPENVAVGLYALDDGDDDGSPVEVAVVFNAFLPADPVHLSEARAREEYLFSEAGLIWRGSANSNFPGAWDFAQFDATVVLAAFWLLELLDYERRGDPIAVTRHLSAAVNANDEGGVIVGRWDGEYSDGVPPSQWTGSGSVLRAFFETGRPVKYGQCWVFAGVLASVCRALGIPTRVTSNFSSAHDTTRPFNRAVDFYYDRAGNMIEERSSDSIWNFHVWCEAWMRRPDLVDAGEQLGLDLNGWQAIDATPQELSNGLFQMGPTPLPAVKNGYALDYDADFVIGEVNADVLYYWQGDDSDEFVVQNKRTRNVGRFISTKAVGSDQRNDITLLYKHAEGSTEERKALSNRDKPSDRIEPPSDQPQELVFTQEFTPRVAFGDDIRVVLLAKNNGSADATVHFSSLARAIRYTGEPTSRIDRTTDDVSVPSGGTAELIVTLSSRDYEPHLVRDVQTVKFNNSAKVGATGEAWADECIVRVYGDDALEVAGPASLELGGIGNATVTVTNKFRVALTNVVVNAEGRGLTQPTRLRLDRIEPGAKKEATVLLEGSVVGDRTLVVTLDTEELQDVVKSVIVRVYNAASMGWLDRLIARLSAMFG